MADNGGAEAVPSGWGVGAGPGGVGGAGDGVGGGLGWAEGHRAGLGGWGWAEDVDWASGVGVEEDVGSFDACPGGGGGWQGDARGAEERDGDCGAAVGDVEHAGDGDHGAVGSWAWSFVCWRGAEEVEDGQAHAVVSTSTSEREVPL